MKEWKFEMNKRDLLNHMGSVSQLGGIKRYEFSEGKARGSEGIDIVTGTGLDYTILPGRCMDLAWTRYKGVPISYMSKAEIADASYLEQEGFEWLRSFYAGMLTTCGFSNVGGPCQEERRIFGMQQYGLHGRISHIPANEICTSGKWIDGKYVMTVEGVMRQSAVHAENLVLRRTITSVLGEKKIHIHDEIENEGQVEEPFMVLYHVNIGYPLLDKCSRLLTDSEGIQPAEEVAASELEICKQFQEPMLLRDERCYFHNLHVDSNGNAEVALVNEELELGISLRFNKEQLPCFTEWKMMAEGEYVLGMEPGNTTPMGRVNAREAGTLQYLQPGEVRYVDLELEVLDGLDEISAAEKRINSRK